MCTHSTWVINKYTGERVFVPCRECEECQMDKANKAYTRLRSHIDYGNYFTLFITLNYDNDYLPYIHSSDCDGGSIVNIYRNSRVRYYMGKKFVYKGKVVVDSFCPLTNRDIQRCDNSGVLINPVKFSLEKGDEIGVVYPRDFTNFMKRFRVNLERHYNINPDEILSYYRVAEYGPTTYRPHFHALLFFPSDYTKHYEHIKQAVVTSWPFCSGSQMERNVEIAVKPASYVSRYTARPSNSPALLQVRHIAAGSSHSKVFGFNNPVFSPSSILEKVREHDARYSVQSVDKQGRPVTLDMLIPQYVANRYFPKFKGSYFLTPQQILCTLSYTSLAYCSRLAEDYTQDDFVKFVRQVERCRLRLGLSRLAYAQFWLEFHTQRAAASLRSNDEITVFDCFDNLETYLHDARRANRFLSLNVASSSYLNHLISHEHDDPNTFAHRVHRASDAILKHADSVKRRKLNAYTHNLRVRKFTVNNYKNGKYQQIS